METQLSVQQMAERIGLSAHTLRYYERIGLINAVARDAGGRRRYSAADLEWLRFLTRLRDTGMSIQDMQRYAELRRRGASTHSDRQYMMEAHLQRLRGDIARLQALEEFVAEKVRWYREHKPVSIDTSDQEIQHADQHGPDSEPSTVQRSGARRTALSARPRKAQGG